MAKVAWAAVSPGESLTPEVYPTDHGCYHSFTCLRVLRGAIVRMLRMTDGYEMGPIWAPAIVSAEATELLRTTHLAVSPRLSDFPPSALHPRARHPRARHPSSCDQNGVLEERWVGGETFPKHFLRVFYIYLIKKN